MPLLVFAFARSGSTAGRPVVAALLTGIFSFNTIYASTQSSDAVCTVIFIAAVVAVRGRSARGGLAWFALAGVLRGVAPQFRPNLILVPLLLAVFALVDADAEARGQAACSWPAPAPR